MCGHNRQFIGWLSPGSTGKLPFARGQCPSVQPRSSGWRRPKGSLRRGSAYFSDPSGRIIEPVSIASAGREAWERQLVSPDSACGRDLPGRRCRSLGSRGIAGPPCQQADQMSGLGAVSQGCAPPPVPSSSRICRPEHECQMSQRKNRERATLHLHLRGLPQARTLLRLPALPPERAPTPGALLPARACSIRPA